MQTFCRRRVELGCASLDHRLVAWQRWQRGAGVRGVAVALYRSRSNECRYGSFADDRQSAGAARELPRRSVRCRSLRHRGWRRSPHQNLLSPQRDVRLGVDQRRGQDQSPGHPKGIFRGWKDRIPAGRGSQRSRRDLCVRYRHARKRRNCCTGTHGRSSPVDYLCIRPEDGSVYAAVFHSGRPSVQYLDPDNPYARQLRAVQAEKLQGCDGSSPTCLVHQGWRDRFVQGVCRPYSFRLLRFTIEPPIVQRASQAGRAGSSRRCFPKSGRSASRRATDCRSKDS